MSRRLSTIRFAHQMHNRPDPTTGARVIAVWGRHPPHPRRTSRAGHPADAPRAARRPGGLPTYPDLEDPGRAAEPDLAGLRDRALLLVGFFAALRRSELSALTLDQVTEHPNGLVLALPRSKTNPHGAHAELVVLPPRRPPHPLPGHRPGHLAWTRCPTARTACAPVSSPTLTCAARPGGPSPPNPAPLPGHRRHLRSHPRSLGRQRRYPTRAVGVSYGQTARGVKDVAHVTPLVGHSQPTPRGGSRAPHFL